MAETGTSADGTHVTRSGAERLHAIIRDLAIELEPDRRETLEVMADSILDRDLGIDSLARLELSLRIERGFGVRLAEQALMEAVTPTDLLAALEPGIEQDGQRRRYATTRRKPLQHHRHNGHDQQVLGAFIKGYGMTRAFDIRIMHAPGHRRDNADDSTFDKIP